MFGFELWGEGKGGQPAQLAILSYRQCLISLIGTRSWEVGYGGR